MRRLYVLVDRDQDLVWNVILSRRMEQDSWYWLKEKSGMFSVKSAYRLLKDQKLIQVFGKVFGN